MKDVLIINSYAGSLVLGCKAAGFPIRGSYEDAAFGIEAQKLNFPELKYVDRLPWPEDDLSKTVVIAHPPCAGFSNQGVKGGVNSKFFECHARVMGYALGQNCEGLAIESVCGAFGAAETYQQFAEKYGYNFFMLKVNAVSFGLPQWRPRAWMIFSKMSLLTVNFKPQYKVFDAVLEPTRVSDQCTIKDQTYLAMRFKRAKFDFHKFIKHDSIGPFIPAVAEWLGIEQDEVQKRTGTEGLFRVRLPRKLNLLEFTPTILWDSLWYAAGRPLNRIEYQRIMGFPDSFKWPEKMMPQFRKYLSKGVCPPVAAWVLEQISQHGISFSHSCQPGELLDLNPHRARALDAAKQLEMKYEKTHKIV